MCERLSARAMQGTSLAAHLQQFDATIAAILLSRVLFILCIEGCPTPAVPVQLAACAAPHVRMIIIGPHLQHMIRRQRLVMAGVLVGLETTVSAHLSYNMC